jgi:ADP-ribose pyrophosphatase
MSKSRSYKGDELVLLGRKSGCENSLIDVYLDDVITLGGEIIKDYIVISPKIKNADLESGVIIIPSTGSEILLINVFRYPLGQYVWELPRGFIDPNESAVEAARRELEEETGIQVLETDLDDVGLVAPEGGILAAKNHIYIARNCIINHPLVTNEHGHRSMKLFKNERVVEMLKTNQIIDSNTSVALYRFLYEF